MTEVQDSYAESLEAQQERLRSGNIKRIRDSENQSFQDTWGRGGSSAQKRFLKGKGKLFAKDEQVPPQGDFETVDSDLPSALGSRICLPAGELFLEAEQCLDFYTRIHLLTGFSSGSGKKSCQCRRRERLRLDPWVGSIQWIRKWQPTLVFLPRKCNGQRSLIEYMGLQRVRQD